MVFLFPRCKACWVSAQTTKMRCRATEPGLLLLLLLTQPWNDSTGQLVWLPFAKQLWLPADICYCLASFRLRTATAGPLHHAERGVLLLLLSSLSFSSPLGCLCFFGALWTVLLNHVAEPLGRSTAVSSRTCVGLPRGCVLSSTPGRLWLCHLVVRQTILSSTQDFNAFLETQTKSNLSELNRKKSLLGWL